MVLRVGETEFKLLRDLIEERSGILLGDDKTYLIENRLSHIVEEAGCANFKNFYRKIKNLPPSEQLWNEVIEAITTHETLWFRDEYPFKVVQEYILPKYKEETETGKRSAINIWSAACSTGQEPYSIAMTLLDYYRVSGGEDICRNQVKIFATDISSAVIATAGKGQYDKIAIRRGLPDQKCEQYFRYENGFWYIDQKIIDMVTFKQFNLYRPLTALERFDIIFLRNVIIYFSDHFKKELFEKIAEVLSPGGFMFLGTGETTGGYTTAFEIVEHAGSIFYRVK
ncbi:MAG TPA: protein-glutamate O-methyltransferase CheR [Spirochaetes bacterium]|nr:protein-glutamate O-methyltransferase CheR [Spirochaetota bacterium]